ncbi:MAG: hypothetical protein ACFBWO_18420, partial [Paracoccaceae bacterium]
MSFFRLDRGTLALAGSVSALALAATPASADPAAYIDSLASAGEYLSGDKHNHTTCTDGSTSVATLVDTSLLVYDLDWFAQTGHGGAGNRDCRFDERYLDGNPFDGGEGDVLWVDTIGEDEILGTDPDEDPETPRQYMWRWQSIFEYAGPSQYGRGEIANQPAWIGVEHIAPGHEHVDVSVFGNQLAGDGDFYSTAQFEYLWDRADDDTEGGEAFGFEDPANNGVEKIDDDELRNSLEVGLAGQARAVESVEWLVSNFGDGAYYVPAHVERQGAFVDDDNEGWNVENFRELYNAGLLDQNDPTGESIVFGAEMLAGHQFANGGRGTYELDRPTAGFGTYGGAGAYSAAEIAVPGTAFDGGPGDITNGATTTDPIVMPTDGEALTQEDLDAIKEELDSVFGGTGFVDGDDEGVTRLIETSGANQYDGFANDVPIQQVALGRPGLQTMWDALLGEGRKFFNFGSSDWHNRGTFGPFEPQSTLDPYPGEYNKLYAYTEGGGRLEFTQAQVDEIVAGMRSGNSWSVFGDLIDEFFIAICQGDTCATMGETLNVDPAGERVTFEIRMRDPEGPNNAPYTFPNPSLFQMGIEQPINEPVLDHVDVVRGDITGLIQPGDPAFSENVSNPSTELFARFMREDFEQEGEFLVRRGSIRADRFTNDMYFRLRGTNMPIGTPNETDADGNPVLDEFASFIPCPFEGSDSPTDEQLAFDARAMMGATNSGLVAEVITRMAFDGSVCPDHLPRDESGTKYLDADVEAWADLWFYANPIFIEVDEDAVDDALEQRLQRQLRILRRLLDQLGIDFDDLRCPDPAPPVRAGPTRPSGDAARAGSPHAFVNRPRQGRTAPPGDRDAPRSPRARSSRPPPSRPLAPRARRGGTGRGRDRPRPPKRRGVKAKVSRGGETATAPARPRRPDR